jgi:hypothetical protein
MKQHFQLLTILIILISCKKNPKSDISSDASYPQSQFQADMFVPFSNVGYDPAFCAASSAVHAMMANRARFYPAKIPSQKCPAKWTQKDDAAYDQRVWKAIEQEVLKQDFTSNETIHIHGAFNFYEYGSRNLQFFAPTIRRVQTVLENPLNWKNVRKADYVPFNKIAEITRQNNFLILFVHSADKQPDSSYANTIDAMRVDCESRGYMWDTNANRCDWNKQLSDVNTDVNTSTEDGSMMPTQQSANPTQPPSKLGQELDVPNVPKEVSINHAILVTGSYDDRTLEVYTTWQQELMRWRADFSVDIDGTPKWMSNPVIIETIPIKVGEDRSTAPDLIADVNTYYGYTGPNASPGCPGDSTQADQNTPVSGELQLFSFNIEITKVQGSDHLIINDVKGCQSKSISWSITNTSYDPTRRGAIADVQTVAHSRWSTNSTIKSTSWRVDPRINRAVITGACGDQTYSLPVFGAAIDGGPK